MKLFVLFLLFGLSIGAQAQSRNQERTRWELYPLSSLTRFERDEEQGISGHSALNLAFGVSLAPYGALIELTSYKTGTSSGFSEIDRSHTEALLWLRREMGVLGSWRWTGALAIGASQEVVDTRVDDLRVVDRGRVEALTGVSLGGFFEIQKTVRISMEGRLLYGLNLEPRLQPDVVLRAGLVF